MKSPSYSPVSKKSESASLAKVASNLGVKKLTPGQQKTLAG